jgi:hypothetical protein
MDHSRLRIFDSEKSREKSHNDLWRDREKYM